MKSDKFLALTSHYTIRTWPSSVIPNPNFLPVKLQRSSNVTSSWSAITYLVLWCSGSYFCGWSVRVYETSTIFLPCLRGTCVWCCIPQAVYLKKGDERKWERRRGLEEGKGRGRERLESGGKRWSQVGKIRSWGKLLAFGRLGRLPGEQKCLDWTVMFNWSKVPGSDCFSNIPWIFWYQTIRVLPVNRVIVSYNATRDRWARLDSRMVTLSFLTDSLLHASQQLKSKWPSQVCLSHWQCSVPP